ncbi:MAG TPA: LytTR family DNA-binding domain-containing protein [Wenzhouxiangellaceae bacterium]|nr:LytTR family DNA-binding domain-containing protein [Wenzhouxiangellaceae bacterium]
MEEDERIRVLIVDDEPPAVERLSAMVAGFSDCRVVGCESRPERVLERCRRLRPDAVLLDVEMPGTSGLEIAAGIQVLDPIPAVIFITAHDQYAVDAFDVEAVDYVVKPVRETRLRQALDRVASARRIDQGRVCARIGDRLVRIALDEIRAFTAEDKCTLVHAVSAKAVMDDPLKSIEAEFGDRFVRIHRNALASRYHLRSLFSDRADVVRVEIEGIDLQPEVSRRNQTLVKKLLSGTLY